MKALAIIVLALLAASAFADRTPTSYVAKLPAIGATPTTTAPLLIEIGAPSSKLTFKSNSTDSSVQLCLQRGILPPVSSAWAGCTKFIEVGPNTTDVALTIPVYAGNYYFSAISAAHDAISLDITWDFISCAAGEVWTGTSCNNETLLFKMNQQSSIELTAGTNTVYFMASLPKSLFPSLYTLTISTGATALEQVTVDAFYGSNDVTAKASWSTVVKGTNSAPSLSVPFGSSIDGVWYFVAKVVSGAASSANISIVAGSCPTGAEPGCAAPVHVVEAFTTVKLPATSSFVYFAYNASAATLADWSFGVSTTTGKSYNAALKVFVAKGYLPLALPNGEGVIADWTGGCTLSTVACTSVVSVVLPKSSDIYYIAVSYTNATLPSTPIAAWAATSCPTCIRGNCQSNLQSMDYGVCTCPNGWSDVTCSTAVDGFKVQIIVVIIIGGLLLLTALIGLVAWFVSRKKQSGYSQL